MEKDTAAVLMHPIAHIRTDFKEKFGIPRQSGLVEALKGRIVFTPAYRDPTALRGLEAFSHIWILWYFSEAVRDTFSPTVRPPRLGGNTRVGVFATRSPFRPNHIGLSCVRLLRIDYEAVDGPVLYVSGVDMLDGTPIFDIKPYIPVADCHPDASEGYTAETRCHSLAVIFDCETGDLLGEAEREALIGILSGDPRPGYDDDPKNEYGMTFADFDIGFTVENGTAHVIRVKRVGS